MLLPNSLLINLVTNRGIEHIVNDHVTRNDIENLIKKRLIVDYIETGIGRDQRVTPTKEKKYISESSEVLNELYSLLVKPIESQLAEVDRLYITSDGYLAALPFAALVSGFESNGLPRYLIEDKEIAYLRPSFIANSISKPKKTGALKELLAVANPHNSLFPMADLGSAVSELNSANKSLNPPADKIDIAYEKGNDTKNDDVDHLPNATDKPTEMWLSDKLQKNKYDIIYFATHGMPYSDTHTIRTQIENAIKKNKPLDDDFKARYAMMKDNLSERTPLNGFLFLSGPDSKDFKDERVPKSEDGLWTIKEVMEMDDGKLAHTKYVILSACNTGVTFVPKAIQKNLESESIADMSQSDIEKDRVSSGLIPGVDQVSFVEGFMQKGVNNVYGTFWFADDQASQMLMSKFMKNLADQGEKHDAVKAFSKAQREFVSDAKNGKLEYAGFSQPFHPYLWAVGGIFGK